MLTDGIMKQDSQLTPKVEFIIKAATAILAVLYALGFFVSNIQLMEIGIADFSSINARNVLVGSLFAYYFIVFLLFVCPIPLAIGYGARIARERNFSKLSEKIWFCFKIICIVPFAIAFSGSVAGTLVGYVLPWGLTWISGYEMGMSLSNVVPVYKIVLSQLALAYWHPKIIAGGIYIMIFFIVILYRVINRKKDNNTVAVFKGITRPWLLPNIVVASIAVLSLFLFEYADEVFGNFKYNLGGGQPRVAEVHIESQDSLMCSMIGIHLTSKETQKILVSKPVAIWYQDDKLLYVSPLQNRENHPTVLLALDKTIIRTMRFYRGYVKIQDGGQINEFQMLKDQDTSGVSSDSLSVMK